MNFMEFREFQGRCGPPRSAVPNSFCSRDPLKNPWNPMDPHRPISPCSQYLNQRNNLLLVTLFSAGIKKSRSWRNDPNSNLIWINKIGLFRKTIGRNRPVASVWAVGAVTHTDFSLRSIFQFLLKLKIPFLSNFNISFSLHTKFWMFLMLILWSLVAFFAFFCTLWVRPTI